MVDEPTRELFVHAVPHEELAAGVFIDLVERGAMMAKGAFGGRGAKWRAPRDRGGGHSFTLWFFDGSGEGS